jgi:DNA-binding MarR family transcriptional regulator
MGSMQETHGGTASAENIAELLDRLARATHALQFAHGLNPAQWESLRFLNRANRYSRSPSTLAEYLGTTKGTASQTLRALEDKGYIQRCRDCADRRGVSLDLTVEGRALLKLDPMQDLAKAVAGLSAPCSERLAEGLSQLLGHMRSRCGKSEFGVCGRCSHLVTPGSEESNRCGLTGDKLGPDECKQLCVNFNNSDAEERKERAPTA